MMKKASCPASNGGRLIFNEDTYKTALNAHYRQLLKLSQATVGQPSSREMVMLNKISSLEKKIADDQALQAHQWDPLRDRINLDTSTSRDADIQIGIYGIQVSMQSIATIDSAFDTALNSALQEVTQLETKLETHASHGAPKLGKSRIRRGLLEESHASDKIGTVARYTFSHAIACQKPTHSSTVQYSESKQTSHMKRLINGSHISSEASARKISTSMFSHVPVYFSDNYRASVGSSKFKTNKVEVSKMTAEEEEHKAIERLISSETLEKDFEIFVLRADRYGALPAEMFCSTRNPGRLYENLIYASATLLQLWWKILWPHRKALKESAALLLQKIWRGRQCRIKFQKVLLNEEKVKAHMKKLIFRSQACAFFTWQLHVEQNKKIKYFMGQIMVGMKKNVFEKWSKACRFLCQERKHKLQRTIKNKLDKVKLRIFYAWNEYARKMIKMKEKLARHMSRIEHTCFFAWANSVRDTVVHKQQLKCAVTIQRVFRGFCGRNMWLSRHATFTNACTSIQKLRRGHLARRKAKLLLSYKRKRHRSVARNMRRSQLRLKQSLLLAKERERLNIENRVMDKAGRAAKSKFIKTIRSKFGVLLYGQRRQEILVDKNAVKKRVLCLRRESFAGKISIKIDHSDESSLIELAIKQIISERIQFARKKAKKSFRQVHPKINVTKVADFEEYVDKISTSK